MFFNQNTFVYFGMQIFGFLFVAENIVVLFYPLLSSYLFYIFFPSLSRFKLSSFFIDDHFVNSLNVNNPLGSGGHVARAFSDVIKALWSGRKRPVRPTDLKVYQ